MKTRDKFHRTIVLVKRDDRRQMTGKPVILLCLSCSRAVDEVCEVGCDAYVIGRDVKHESIEVFKAQAGLHEVKKEK